ISAGKESPLLVARTASQLAKKRSGKKTNACKNETRNNRRRKHTKKRREKKPRKKARTTKTPTSRVSKVFFALASSSIRGASGSAARMCSSSTSKAIPNTSRKI